MNKQDESCLRKNKYALQTGLKVDEILLGHLNAEEVLSDGVLQDIESKPTRSAKASALLSTLPRCGPTAFKVFVEALDESGQKHLVELLVPPQTLAHQNEHSPVKMPTEVSSEPKENVANGESNKEQTSGSKTKEMTEQPSTASETEETKRVVYHDDCKSSFINIELKDLTAKISDDPKKARLIKTGRGLIINNEQLTEKESRNGSNYDGINLCELFKKLGFKMDVKKDLTVQQMKDAVEAEKKSLCNDIDGFLLCVMSVGGCGQIRGVDGEKISIDKLTANFVNCPALKGKPKIVIIETCQEGNKKCPNVEPQLPGVDELEGPLKDVHISKPEPSNMIEVRCTIKGYTTARSEFGSWFIRTLIKSIMEHAYQDDVVTLMKAVRDKRSNDGDENMEITVSPDEQSHIYFHPQAKQS